MSINVTTVEVTHDGNAVASQYTYPFRIDNKSAIAVYTSGTKRTEGTDYTVSGVGGANGGTVSFVASLVPASGTANVKFFRDSDPTHAIEYTAGGALPEESLEASLDRIMMVVQEHRDEFTRVIRIPRIHTASSWNGSLGDPGIASVTSGTRLLVFRASGIDTVAASLVSTVDPLTTQGDLLTVDSSSEPTRLANTGSALAVLLTSSSNPFWSSGVSTANTFFKYDGANVVWGNVPDDPNYSENLALEASVTTSALTFTIVGKNGSLPVASNAVRLAFRSSVASTGTYSIASLASTVQFTLLEGANLGIGAASSGRVYAYACNDGGEVKLGVARKALFDEGSLQTTVAVTSLVSATGTLYTTSALTNVPVRLIGIAEITAGAVQGSWETLPEVMTPWKLGMRKNGGYCAAPSRD